MGILFVYQKKTLTKKSYKQKALDEVLKIISVSPTRARPRIPRPTAYKVLEVTSFKTCITNTKYGHSRVIVLSNGTGNNRFTVFHCFNGTRHKGLWTGLEKKFINLPCLSPKSLGVCFVGSLPRH